MQYFKEGHLDQTQEYTPVKQNVDLVEVVYQMNHPEEWHWHIDAIDKMNTYLYIFLIYVSQVLIYVLYMYL